MTHDPETTLAAYMQECTHLMQMAALAHIRRPLFAVYERTLQAAIEAHERAGRLLHEERRFREHADQEHAA